MIDLAIHCISFQIFIATAIVEIPEYKICGQLSYNKFRTFLLFIGANIYVSFKHHSKSNKHCMYSSV